ncbi:hypothetical protein HWV62_18224 [Athelia sp. TMB]|nr:hypothetical protein HWV62_18224 [Athelia sp. TMB]
MSFSMSHTVTLEHPLDVVFPVLSDPNQMERLQQLLPEAQHFTFLPPDHVEMPTGGLAGFVEPTYPTSAKGLPRPREMKACEVTDGNALTQRVNFEFNGETALLCGLIHRPLSVAGAQIVDADARIVLYESGVAAQGIKELKLRTFEEVDLADGLKGTRVRETVWGTCPVVLSYLLKIIAPGVLKHHMEMYYKLFE